jgi:serine/threonine protein kinase
LEAGLREVYFGSWLAQQKESDANMYTRYVDHFFRERPGRNLELWIVLRDAGPSLRSFLYTGVSVGDYVVYQHSELWTQLRLSLSGQNATHNDKSIVPLADLADSGDSRGAGDEQARSLLGRQLMKMVLRQLVESAAFLHENGVVHRDIKPSNILCQTNIDLKNLALRSGTSPVVHCVLADFSSAWNNYTDWHLYTRGPSKNEQTDEYAPPEAVWVGPLYDSPKSLAPQFDS